MTNLQSLNAYSYVLNNPLSFTDPSGFFFKSLFRAIGNFFKSVFRAIGSVLKAVLKSSIVRAAIQIVACGVGGPPGCVAAASALVIAAGGSIKEAALAAIFSFAQIGSWQVTHILGDILQTTGTLAHSLVHGVVGGALSVAQGGSFLQGFASNAIGDVGGLVSQGAFGAPGTGGDQGMFLRTAVAATAGGLAAEVTGGKFANGALTAAMAHMYNAEAHNAKVREIAEMLQDYGYDVLLEPNMKDSNGRVFRADIMYRSRGDGDCGCSPEVREDVQRVFGNFGIVDVKTEEGPNLSQNQTTGYPDFNHGSATSYTSKTHIFGYSNGDLLPAGAVVIRYPPSLGSIRYYGPNTMRRD